MRWIASAAFGLEGLVKQELAALNLPGTPVLGGVAFEGGGEDAFRACLHLRTADRVRLLLGEEEAESFDALFGFVQSLPWEELLPGDAAINVSASCVRSRLMSPRDCQSIAKKAVVERLRARAGLRVLPETGPAFAVDVHLHKDRARVTLDASGEALSRRGYRTWTGEAPLRETLAAAMLLLSPWKFDQPLRDPLCGTGTLLVEAAFLASRRAPGLARSFALEEWAFLERGGFAALRKEARARFDPGRIGDIAGSDIDPQALDLAGRHVAQAGLQGKIRLENKDLRALRPGPGPGSLICNPPYGERLGSRREAEALYRELGSLWRRAPGHSLSVISPHPGFERLFGRRADKRRRLYNGRLECEFLQFAPYSNTVSGSVKPSSAGGRDSSSIRSPSSPSSS